MKKEGTLLSRSEAAREAGFSEHQQKQAIRLASILEDEFEETIETITCIS